MSTLADGLWRACASRQTGRKGFSQEFEVTIFAQHKLLKDQALTASSAFQQTLFSVIIFIFSNLSSSLGDRGPNPPASRSAQPWNLSSGQNDLLRELQLFQGIVERKNTIPILANVLDGSSKAIEVRFLATDLEVGSAAVSVPLLSRRAGR